MRVIRKPSQNLDKPIKEEKEELEDDTRIEKA